MIKSRCRLGVFNRPIRFHKHEPYKVAFPTEVAVRNPITGKDEVTTVLTFKEEQPVDPVLKASDFELDVLIRNNAVNLLRDCGKYLQPSTPEEYMDIVTNFSVLLEYQKRSVEPTAASTAASTPAPSAASSAATASNSVESL